MKIKVTNVLSPGLATPFLNFTSKLQKFLSEQFESFDAGDEIDMFMVTFVAVFDDPDMNAKFVRQHDQCARFKGLDGRWIKDIEVAIPIKPTDVLKIVESEAIFEKYLFEAFVNRLKSPINRMPKNFKHSEFLCLLREALSKFR